MTSNTTFGGWQLSSSDESDDQKVANIPFACFENESGLTQDILDMSVEKYVPLSARLQAKNEKKTDVLQEEFPVFVIPKKTSVTEKKSYRYEAGKENLQVKSTANVRSTLSKSPQPKKTTGVKPKPSAERNTKKQEKDKEAAKRKAMLAHIKAMKPEECMKYMDCSVSHLIVSMFDNIELMKELQTDFAPSCCVEYFDTPCVKWKRKVPLFTEDQPSSSSMSEVNDEKEMLVVIPVTEFVRMVHAYTSTNKEEQTLTSWVKYLQFQNPSFKIHLVCYGLEKYQKEKSKSKSKKNSGIPNVTPDEIEEVLVDLQIDCDTSVLYFEKPTELVTMIKQITKAIAEAPYKRMKRQDVVFINEIPSVKVNLKTGEGMKKLWKQMIQQFHKVSPDMSSAISAKYPTLWSLFEAYETCNGDEDMAEYLLADIPVRRGVGTIQTKRRIGPELSKKIYRFLMSHNPDEYLY